MSEEMTWYCGCGTTNGVNLANCAVCTRPRGEGELLVNEENQPTHPVSEKPALGTEYLCADGVWRPCKLLPVEQQGYLTVEANGVKHHVPLNNVRPCPALPAQQEAEAETPAWIRLGDSQAFVDHDKAKPALRAKPELVSEHGSEKVMRIVEPANEAGCPFQYVDRATPEPGEQTKEKGLIEVLQKAFDVIHDAFGEYGNCDCTHDPCVIESAFEEAEKIILSENGPKSSDARGVSTNPLFAKMEAACERIADQTSSPPALFLPGQEEGEWTYEIQADVAFILNSHGQTIADVQSKWAAKKLVAAHNASLREKEKEKP